MIKNRNWLQMTAIQFTFNDYIRFKLQYVSKMVIISFNEVLVDYKNLNTMLMNLNMDDWSTFMKLNNWFSIDLKFTKMHLVFRMVNVILKVTLFESMTIFKLYWCAHVTPTSWTWLLFKQNFVFFIKTQSIS